MCARVAKATVQEGSATGFEPVEFGEPVQVEANGAGSRLREVARATQPPGE